mmetsp:Transcript_11352/g.36073  ORF Transcript_11352/g.36073 Transcript_11352/m.36073 type:complete len:265 (+) Transcript_11352:1719-2513(+)
MGIGVTGIVRATDASCCGGGFRRPRPDFAFVGPEGAAACGTAGGCGCDGDCGCGCAGGCTGASSSSCTDEGSRSDPPALSSRLIRDKVEERRAVSERRRLPLDEDDRDADEYDDSSPLVRDTRLPDALTDPCPCSASARSILAKVAFRCADGGCPTTSICHCFRPITTSDGSGRVGATRNPGATASCICRYVSGTMPMSVLDLDKPGARQKAHVSSCTYNTSTVWSAVHDSSPSCSLANVNSTVANRSAGAERGVLAIDQLWDG